MHGMNSPGISNRRQFLSGQAAARQITDWADSRSPAGGETAPTPDPSSAPNLVSFSRPAMACQFEVFLNAAQYSRGASVAIDALDLIERLEAQMTVYSESSEVMHINRTAAQKAVVVEPRLFGLLELAVELYHDTRGAFDVTSGSLSQVWGFHRRQAAIPTPRDLEIALARVGTDRIELDHNTSSVRFRAPEVELNLGGIGKGYALDCCADMMTATGMSDFLWHGGQSSVLARGNGVGNADSQQGWIVGVRHPLRPEQRLAEIRLRDRALATSGSGVQFFRHHGKRYGHILDPRTGLPAEGVLSATVIAPSAATADALSTAFYVLGSDDAAEYCRCHADVAFLILNRRSSGTGVDIVHHGLDETDLTLLTEH